MRIGVMIFEDCHAGWHQDCPVKTEIDGEKFFCECKCHGSTKR